LWPILSQHHRKCASRDPETLGGGRPAEVLGIEFELCPHVVPALVIAVVDLRPAGEIVLDVFPNTFEELIRDSLTLYAPKNTKGREEILSTRGASPNE
jgi:hypothetical protein